jgi:hypothetical protein
VEIDEHAARSLQSLFAEEPTGDVLQCVQRDAFRALSHDGDAQICSVRDEGCEQSWIGISGPRAIAAGRNELPRKAAPIVDLDEEPVTLARNPHKSNTSAAVICATLDISRTSLYRYPAEASRRVVEKMSVQGDAHG